MKLHWSDMHMAGPNSHAHLHFFSHRSQARPVAERWTAHHTVLISLVITFLIAALVATYLFMFNTYQLTGVWQLFGN